MPAAIATGMNSPTANPVPGRPVVPITKQRIAAADKSGPRGEVRPIAGPHSPLHGGPRVSLPLIYTLKVIEPGSCRVVSSSRIAGPEEASAALRLLGPTWLQPVLISRTAAQFFPRLS